MAKVVSDLKIAIQHHNASPVSELVDVFNSNNHIDGVDVFNLIIRQARFCSEDQKQKAFEVVKIILDHKVLGHYSLVINIEKMWAAIIFIVGNMINSDGDLNLLELLLSHPRINEHLNEEIVNELNILETAISFDFNPKYLDLLKKHGAVCNPIASKFQIALSEHKEALIIALMDASPEESLKTPDANGHTVLSHLIHAAAPQLGNCAAAAAIDDAAPIAPKIFKALEALIHRKGAAEGDTLLFSEGDIECLFKLIEFFPDLVSPCRITSFNITDPMGAVAPHPRSEEFLYKLWENVERAHAVFEYVNELLPKDVNTIVMGYVGACLGNSGLSNHDLANLSSSRHSHHEIEVVGEDGAAALI